MQAIETKYYGPTNTRESKIVAKCLRGQLSVSYDHALDTSGNHLAACEALCAKFAREDATIPGNVSRDSWKRPMIGGCLPSGSWAWVISDSIYSLRANAKK